jgi:hypothetical protein
VLPSKNATIKLVCEFCSKKSSGYKKCYNEKLVKWPKKREKKEINAIKLNLLAKTAEKTDLRWSNVQQYGA